MKKTLKLIVGIVAIATFGLNLSIASNGEFSILPTALASDPEEEAQKWAATTNNCYNSRGELIGTKTTCFKGDALTCTPKACPTSTPEPE